MAVGFWIIIWIKNIRVQRGQVILFQSQFNQVAQMRETSWMHHCDVVPVQVEFIQEVQSFPEFPPGWSRARCPEDEGRVVL